MKKVLSSFAFWFLLAAIAGVVIDLVGIDDINLFIGLNPILNVLSSIDLTRDAIASIPYLWHILSVVTMVGYGAVIDMIIRSIKKK